MSTTPDSATQPSARWSVGGVFLESLASRDYAQMAATLSGDVRFLRRALAQRRGAGNPPVDALDIMGRDHSPGERHVGKVAAVGMKSGVGQVRRTRQSEGISGGARRRPVQ